MPAGYSFHPRVWVIVLAGAGCAAFVALGQWQGGRADEKRALANLERIAVEGTFVPERSVLLDNKVRHKRAGYEVITPLRLRDGTHVLVNRGWLPATATRDVLPPVRTPATPVRIEGVKRERLPRVLVPGVSSGTVRQTLDIAGFARETGLQLQPFFLEQHSDSGDGLARDWAAPDASIEKHASYSLQWYSLAALAAVLGLLFSFRRVAAP